MKVKFQRYSLLIIIVISLLVISASAQRGGSSSRSKSRSKSNSKSGGNALSGLVVLLTIIVGTVQTILDCFSTDKQELRRKTTIEQEMMGFLSRMEKQPSTLKEWQRQDMRKAFLKRSYIMKIRVFGSSQKYNCQFKVQNLKRESDTKFRVSASGDDELGKSKMEGYLVFTDKGFRFKLSKVYNNRKKAGQRGRFDILFFEGDGDANRMSGSWAFYRHEAYSKYSGNWFLIKKF